MTLISRDQMPPSTPYEAKLRKDIQWINRQTEMYQALLARYNGVVVAARAWNAVYADGEGTEVQEPYLEKLAQAVAELNAMAVPATGGIPNSFLQAARDAPSILDVLEDPNGPAAEHVFPELMKKADE